MQSRTRKLFTGATLALLALACATAFGAADASAAHKAKVHKISACGAVLTKAGTYELTKSVTDSGNGPCITLSGDNITLYLDSHTITGTGSDVCFMVQGGGTAFNVNETIDGGSMPKPTAKTPKKAKPVKPAKLTGCGLGLEVIRTSRTTVGNLNMVSPVNAGVVAILAAGMNLSHITAAMGTAINAPGFVLQAGGGNVVSDSTVDYDGNQSAFAVGQETNDTFMSDTVKDTYNGNGNAGTGFNDLSSARDTFSHCTSTGQANGFILAPQGAGPVTVTHDSATGSAANGGSFGFSIVGAFEASDSASPFHTLVSHSTAHGFGTGFNDQSAPATALAEKWIGNAAYDYSAFGFKIGAASDYTMTGNIADGNTAAKKYVSGSSIGFLLATASSSLPLAQFSNNQAYDSQYGFLAAGTVVSGTGNIAKRNQYNSLNVEIDG